MKIFYQFNYSPYFFRANYKRQERYCFLTTCCIYIQLLQMARDLFQSILFVIAATCAIALEQKDSGSASQIHIVNTYNVNEIMNCRKSDPIWCQLEEDWTLLFFDSNNSRQLQTFEYLIPGFAIQIAYSSLQHKQGQFVYPNSAVIDWYVHALFSFTSGTLCQSIGSNDLPLVLYRTSKHPQSIRYKGYVTLSGLISFIKSHDPQTSYLAEVYEPEGDSLEFEDVPKQKSKILSKQWKTKLQSIMAAKNIAFSQTSAKPQDQYSYMQKNDKQRQEQRKAENQIEEAATMSSDGQKASQTQYERTEKQSRKQSNHQYKDIDQGDGEYKKEQERYQKVDEETSNNQYAKMERQMNKNKTSGKNKSSKDQKKVTKKKDSQADFFQAVNWASGKVVDGFSSVGFGGIILDIVGWISYIFFFLLFAIICLVAS